MTRFHRPHQPFHLSPRDLLGRSESPSPRILASREKSILSERTPPSSGGGGSGSSSGSDSSSDTSSSSTDSSSSSSSSCAPDDTSGACEKPSGGDSNTLPIILGVVIPIVLAIIVFYYLHRRHLRKLRNEDANDKHKSLDFGLDESYGNNSGKKGGKKGGKKTKTGPEMTTTPLNKTGTRPSHGRGMSMDIDIGSPYVLPPGLHGSRESLHSLSRTNNGDDRYRPATTFIPNDTSSMGSYPSRSRRGPDNSSLYTGSSADGHDGMNQGLLRNASRMSRSMAPHEALPYTSTGPGTGPQIPTIQMPEPSLDIARKELPPKPPGSGLSPLSGQDLARDSYVEGNGGDLRRSNNYLGSMINVRESSLDADKEQHADGPTPSAPATLPQPSLQGTSARKPPPPAINTLPSNPRPKKKNSIEAPAIQLPDGMNFLDDGSEHGDDAAAAAPHRARQFSLPRQNEDERHSFDLMAEGGPQDPSGNLGAHPAGYDVRRLSMGFRPLPPEDPSDDPEARANRIRSFYKEYFDDSKPGPVQGGDDYYEDYGQEYYGDAAFFDPDSGNFIMAGAPMAEPLTRRAMTPPPRAPPRFRGGGPRHHYSPSGGLTHHGPRAFSSASGPMGARGPGGRFQARGKPLPPPSPLNVLPTPHLLKEDSFTLPIDFAPPSTYKDRQAGRPASPRGGQMPYSPMLPAHLPLASSFDDLSVMPSPHALRRSGTFTALDFAPPPRFKNSDTGSDAGSIRSNRSGMSAQHLHNIRTGAYRISRLPKETVGTRNDIQASLRPTWDLRPPGS
ncbi:MAG: hypothetical protein M1837_004791 [Sclerophora amabilis]|nr:MAG: hypothetical protein M1837_004791 [Sclerophora amabilis]